MKIDPLIKLALSEDIGRGDITTRSVIPPDIRIKAALVARQNGVVCGMDLARGVFRAVDKRIRFTAQVKDGRNVKKGNIIASLNGPARGILTGERTALNFLGRLSGISSLTDRFVKKVTPYKVRIMDTRKTTPGLRILEKYAVKTGGGCNHRIGLFDMVLIKDNHLKVYAKGKDRASIIPGIIRKAKQRKGIKVEIEVENLKEFKPALNEKPDIIMLDNMGVKDIRKAVQMRNKSAPGILLEVSGGVTLKNVRDFAKTGIDIISIGALTHSAPALDFAMEIKYGDCPRFTDGAKRNRRIGTVPV